MSESNAGTRWAFRRVSFKGLIGCFVLLVSSSLVFAQTVPQGFVVEDAFPTASYVTFPAQVVFLPDGRKFVVERGGIVWVMTSAGTQLSTPFIDLSQKVLNNFDRGLLGVALDPDFSTTPWVYFVYVVDPDSNGVDTSSVAFSRLERYQASSSNPNVADLSSRQILIGGSWSTGIPDPATDGSHTIGTIRFASDKTLLLNSGDAAHFGSPDAGGLDPAAIRPGRTDSTQDIGAFRAQSLNSLNGKILRIDKETGNGLPSNPYWDGNPSSARSRVWVYGLRNPFRFSIRPGTGNTNPSAGQPGTLYIGSVGVDTWDWVDIARTGGINFGWPWFEGPDTNWLYVYPPQMAYYDPNVLFGAAPNTENPATPTGPSLWWNHTDSTHSSPFGWRGNCAIGGVFYAGTSYPARYQNTYFVADYGKSWIRSVKVDANDNVIAHGDTLFLTGGQGPVDVETDPSTGDLYYVAILIKKVYRIRYTTGNLIPVVNASVSPGYGLTPLVVTLKASGSSDPDGDPLTFKWDMGNGDTLRVADTTYTYTQNGIYTITLTVRDNKGGSSQAAFKEVVGHTAPTAKMTTPSDSSVFSAGATVPLVATQVDTTAGAVTYEWDIDLMHNDHFHPGAMTLFGRTNSFALAIPADGGYYRYRVRLSVTQNSITASDTIIVFASLLLQTKVFLQGPYSTSTRMMSKALRAGGFIPSASPYAQDSRNATTIPATATDWVLIQLRSTLTGSTLASKSAFLRQDGRILADDSTTLQIDKPALAPGGYYIVIRHRNHLAVMSANAVTLSNGSATLYDFTTAQTQANGTNPMIQVSTGVYAMIGGDGNGDGGIDATDRNAVWKPANGTSGYFGGDFNLDGGVDAIDLNTIWRPNNGSGTQVP